MTVMALSPFSSSSISAASSPRTAFARELQEKLAYQSRRRMAATMTPINTYSASPATACASSPTSAGSASPSLLMAILHLLKEKTCALSNWAVS
jgi:hypothetical protein